jgi:DNA 3'-phosphatase
MNIKQIRKIFLDQDISGLIDRSQNYIVFWDEETENNCLAILDFKDKTFVSIDKQISLKATELGFIQITGELLSFPKQAINNLKPFKDITQLILFDKDGTLIKTRSGKTFPESPDDQIPIFDYSYLQRETEDLENNIICSRAFGIISNQKGISLGLKTEDFLCQEINYLIHDLNFPADIFLCCPDEGQTLWTAEVDTIRKIDDFYDIFSGRYDSHFGIPVEFIGSFRKPDHGMILAAPFLYKYINPYCDFEFDEIIFIGDMETDNQAAKNAGIKYWDIEDWLSLNPSLRLI